MATVAAVLTTGSVIAGAVPPTTDTAGVTPAYPFNTHIVGFAQPYSVRVNSLTTYFPTNGAEYNDFEMEIVASPDTESDNIVKHYMQKYAQGDFFTRVAPEAEVRTNLNAFVTAYQAWR